MAPEVPNQASSRLEVPVSIIIDGNEAYHGFVVLVKLAKLHGDVFALACLDLLAILQFETEGGIYIEIQVACHLHIIDGLIDAPHVQVRIPCQLSGLG